VQNLIIEFFVLLGRQALFLVDNLIIDSQFLQRERQDACRGRSVLRITRQHFRDQLAQLTVRFYRVSCDHVKTLGDGVDKRAHLVQ